MCRGGGKNTGFAVTNFGAPPLTRVTKIGAPPLTRVTKIGAPPPKVKKIENVKTPCYAVV